MPDIHLNKKVTDVKLTDITPYNGAHDINPAVDMLAESLQKYGFQQPIVIDADKVIVAGTGLYQAAKKIGMEKVPCVVVDYLTPDEVAQYRIADNMTATFANWNEEKLKKEVSYLEDINELQFCFDEDLEKMVTKQPVKITPLTIPTTAVNIPNSRTVEKTRTDEEKKFKDSLTKLENSLEAKPVEYFEYVCSKCGKKVTVKLQ